MRDSIKTLLKVVNISEDFIDLRHRILHPEGPRSRVVYASDHHPRALHFVVEDSESNEILACGSLLPENDNAEICEDKNRIRGMAVSLKAQGKGFGKLILLKMIEMAKEQQVSYTWCNARKSVLPFYKKRGFVVVGDEFDVPGSGPHYKMIKNYS